MIHILLDVLSRILMMSRTLENVDIGNYSAPLWA